MEGIVVGVDESAASKDGLGWAIDEGRLRQTPVVAVHAWQPPIIPPVVDIGPMLPPPPTDLAALIAEVQKAARSSSSGSCGRSRARARTLPCSRSRLRAPPRRR